jgi:hypothetical protein
MFCINQNTRVEWSNAVGDALAGYIVSLATVQLQIGKLGLAALGFGLWLQDTNYDQWAYSYVQLHERT